MASTISFCRLCSNLMSVKIDENGKCSLNCIVCNATKDVNSDRIAIMKEWRTRRTRRDISFKTIPYDKGVTCTSRINCINPECPSNRSNHSNRSSRDGSSSTAAFTIPRVKLINSLTPDRELTYVCVHCNTVWK